MTCRSRPSTWSARSSRPSRPPRSRPRQPSVPPADHRRRPARDHAALEFTLGLAKASSLGCGRVRPRAWCSRPGHPARPAGGTLMADRPKFDVSLVTPDGAAYEGEAEMMVVPGAAGEIGVL